MQNEQSLNNEGISLIELLKMAWIKKWFILILTAAFTILLVLVVMLMNPRLERLSISFQYNFISESENSLPNGEFFRPSSIISAEFLTSVKNSDQKYSEIDIETILESSNDISLLYDTDTLDNSLYTIEVRTKSFGGTNIATSFLQDLLSYFYQRILLGDDYNRIINNLSLIQNEAVDYKHTIPFLNDVHNSLLTSYSNLQYLNSTLRIADATLQNALAEFNFFFSINPFSNLETLVREGNFIRSESARAALQVELSSLILQRSILQDQIAEIKNAYNDLNSGVQISSSELESLIIREVRLNDQIETLNNAITNGVVPTVDANPDFINLYNSYITTLTEHIATYNSFYRVYVNNQARVSFVGGTSGQTSGSISLVLAIIGGLILGGGIATVTAIALEYPKRKKNNEVK